MRGSCNLYIALEGKESNALLIFSCQRVDAIDYSIGRMPKEYRRFGPGTCPGASRQAIDNCSKTKFILVIHHTCTRLGCYLKKTFCYLFSEGSTVILQLSFCPGKQRKLSENCLQNLFPKEQPFLVTRLHNVVCQSI